MYALTTEPSQSRADAGTYPTPEAAAADAALLLEETGGEARIALAHWEGKDLLLHDGGYIVRFTRIRRRRVR